MPGHAPAPPRRSDAELRKAGRDLLFALHGALRSVRLYPGDNPVVQRTLDDVVRLSGAIIQREGELELRVAGEFIFVNGTRLRLELDTYASFSRIIAVFGESGVGLCRLAAAASDRDWNTLLALLQAPVGESPEERLVRLGERLAAASVGVFDIGPVTAVDEDELERAREAAKRTYAQSVSVTKELIHSVRMGKSANLKRIKRVVQGIVDQILNEEASLMGLTALRDYDEYTFVHSVNVCIFSVALGRKLGLTRLQLYDLGVAALMHDLGKARVPVAVLNKATDLTDEEWRTIASHPWQGALQLFQLRGQTDVPYRAIIVAFEHHMKTDLTGYPRHVRNRTMAIYSRIVAVADAFDAATSRRVYQAARSPAEVLQDLRANPRRGMDPVLVKAFMSLVGHYPVGTLLVLDTMELALVYASNPTLDAVARPIVRIVSDERGNTLFPGTLADLTEKDSSGEFRRTIIKVTDPERYGIRVSDYFAC